MVAVVGDHAMMPDLDEVLLDLAELASQTIPGNDGAGATLVQDGVNVFRSSNGYTQEIDRAQYGVGEGPCISAVDQASTMVSGSIRSGEQRWPRFRAEASRLEVRSVLSLPLVVASQTIGSINVYSSTPNAFTGDAVAIGEAFAGPAASSLSAARLSVEIVDLAAFSGYGLRDRALIEKAVGVLLAQYRLSPAAARLRLAKSATAAGTTLTAAAVKTINNVQQRRAES